jgi:hypothetical protein
MIARIWHGTTHDSKADDYLEYVRRTGVEAHRSTHGNRGDQGPVSIPRSGRATA